MNRAFNFLVVPGVATGLVFTAPAMAAESGFFAESEFVLGAGGGTYDVNDDKFDAGTDAWTVFTGVNFNRALGIELGYVNMPEVRETAGAAPAPAPTPVNPAGATFDPTGYTAALVVSAPVAENFSPYAKAGQFFWNTEGSSPALNTTVDTEGDDPFWGAGLKFGLNKVWDLRAEYDRYKVTEVDFNAAQLMLQGSF
jgi:opacity protein-like surface antigen